MERRGWAIIICNAIQLHWVVLPKQTFSSKANLFFFLPFRKITLTHINLTSKTNFFGRPARVIPTETTVLYRSIIVQTNPTLCPCAGHWGSRHGRDSCNIDATPDDGQSHASSASVASLWPRCSSGTSRQRRYFGGGIPTPLIVIN